MVEKIGEKNLHITIFIAEEVISDIATIQGRVKQSC